MPPSQSEMACDGPLWAAAFGCRATSRPTSEAPHQTDIPGVAPLRPSRARSGCRGQAAFKRLARRGKLLFHTP